MNIDILSIYNPSQIVTSLEYDHYFNEIGPNKLTVGDFNSHHKMWDTRRPNNFAGVNLVDALIHNPDIALLTPTSLPTCFNIHSGNSYTLDLCFISFHLYSSSQVKVDKDTGSDHYPVHTIIAICS